MLTSLVSPVERRYVQAATAPSFFLDVDNIYCPDPTAAVARLDVYNLDTGARVIDGELAALSDVTSEADDYGTAYSFHLEYEWAVGDLDMTGSYGVQFKVTFATAEVEYIPQLAVPIMIYPRAGSSTPISPTTTVYQEVRVDEVNTFDLGDIIYNDGVDWLLADASDYDTLGTNVVTQAAAGYFYYAGPGCVIVFSADQGWTKGDPIYLDPANNGKPTQTLPTTAAYPGQWGHSMGGADSDRSWSFQNYAPWRL